MDCQSVGMDLDLYIDLDYPDLSTRLHFTCCRWPDAESLTNAWVLVGVGEIWALGLGENAMWCAVCLDQCFPSMFHPIHT